MVIAPDEGVVTATVGLVDGVVRATEDVGGVACVLLEVGASVEGAVLLPVVVTEEEAADGELAATDTGADGPTTDDDKLLAADGTAVSVVGPGSVDVQDDKRTALTDSAANTPLRRLFIARPPTVVQVTIPGETGVDRSSSTRTRRSGDELPIFTANIAQCDEQGTLSQNLGAEQRSTNRSNGLHLAGNTRRLTALSAGRSSSGDVIIEGVQQ